jgi:hypothetical protein
MNGQKLKEVQSVIRKGIKGSIYKQKNNANDSMPSFDINSDKKIEVPIEKTACGNFQSGKTYKISDVLACDAGGSDRAPKTLSSAQKIHHTQAKRSVTHIVEETPLEIHEPAPQHIVETTPLEIHVTTPVVATTPATPASAPATSATASTAAPAAQTTPVPAAKAATPPVAPATNVVTALAAPPAQRYQYAPPMQQQPMYSYNQGSYMSPQPSFDGGSLALGLLGGMGLMMSLGSLFGGGFGGFSGGFGGGFGGFGFHHEPFFAFPHEPFGGFGFHHGGFGHEGFGGFEPHHGGFGFGGGFSEGIVAHHGFGHGFRG